MSLRQRIESGQCVTGVFCAIPDPIAIEIVAGSGLDFLCIDAEHSPIDRATLENLIRAADSAGGTPIVRVPSWNSDMIGSALDSGADGVLLPRVSTAKQARRAVDMVRYPPVGVRGAGPGRASRYGASIMPYIATANERLLLAIQIETREAVDNLDEIVSVPGIDLIFIGPGDLSVSCGLTGPQDQETLNTMITGIINTCKTAGKPVGIFRMTAADIPRWQAAGVSLFVVGSDGLMLAQAAAGLVSGKPV